MKKKYGKIRGVVAFGIFFAFALCFGLIVKTQTNSINDSYHGEMLNGYSLAEGCSDEHAMARAYTVTYYNKVNYLTWLDPSIGFYSELLSYDGKKYETVDHSQNYALVKCYKDDTVKDAYVIMLGDASLDSWPSSEVEITGKCDDYFIYDGTFKFDKSSEPISFGRPDYIDGENEREFDSSVYDEVRCECVDWNQRREQISSSKKVNEDAKEILKSQVKNYKYGDGQKTYKSNGIFTSYQVEVISEMAPVGHGENPESRLILTTAYVYHPFAIVLNNNKKLYFFMLLGFLIMELIAQKALGNVARSQARFDQREKDLINGVAHEMKTPLAVTKAYVENWKYIEEADRKEYGDKMIQEIDHMNHLVEDLLQMSRINAGKRKVHAEELSLLELTKAIEKRYEPLIKERDLAISYEVEEGKEYLVEADLELMNIVLSNFLSNAVKYAEKKVTIKLLESKRKIRFEIYNDGKVISPLMTLKVWDSFSTSDDARTDRMTSSGLGLAVVRSILELHKAKYGCESLLNETEFWFELKKLM